MARRWTCFVVLGFFAWATSSFAWPVDWVHDVPVGKEKFVQLPKLDWFEVEDASVARMEWFEDAHELLISGLKPGRTTVLLAAGGKVAAWRIRVNTRPAIDEGAKKAAQRACKDFNETPHETIRLTVTIADKACFDALFALFQTDAYEARHLQLTFKLHMLQAQLQTLKTVLGPRVTAHYAGAVLSLEGTMSPKAHRALLWNILRHTLGRFVLDDAIRELPAAAAVP